jgi:hypothetical protein
MLEEVKDRAELTQEYNTLERKILDSHEDITHYLGLSATSAVLAGTLLGATKLLPSPDNISYLFPLITAPLMIMGLTSMSGLALSYSSYDQEKDYRNKRDELESILENKEQRKDSLGRKLRLKKNIQERSMTIRTGYTLAGTAITLGLSFLGPLSSFEINDWGIGLTYIATLALGETFCRYKTRDSKEQLSVVEQELEPLESVGVPAISFQKRPLSLEASRARQSVESRIEEKLQEELSTGPDSIRRRCSDYPILCGEDQYKETINRELDSPLIFVSPLLAVIGPVYALFCAYELVTNFREERDRYWKASSVQVDSKREINFVRRWWRQDNAPQETGYMGLDINITFNTKESGKLEKDLVEYFDQIEEGMIHKVTFKHDYDKPK